MAAARARAARLRRGQGGPHAARVRRRLRPLTRVWTEGVRAERAAALACAARAERLDAAGGGPLGVRDRSTRRERRRPAPPPGRAPQPRRAGLDRVPQPLALPLLAHENGLRY